MIHYGILGTARIARAFAREKPQNAEISAIASREINKAKKFADEFHIPRAYGTYEDLINDRNIDAVYIPLPHHLHHEYTIKCAQAGKHVLCEKPAALSVQEMTNMTDICKKHGVLFMEAFMYRFLPVHKRVKELVDTGTIGKLRYIDFNLCITLKSSLVSTFRWNKALGGGALFDLGVYGINFSRHMTASEPQVIKSLIYREKPESIDELALITLQCANVVANITVSFITQAYDYTLSGDGASIQVPFCTTGRLIPNKLILKFHDNFEEKVETFDPVNSYKAEAEYFAQCIEKRQRPILDGEDSVKTLKVLEETFKKETPLFLQLASGF